MAFSRNMYRRLRSDSDAYADLVIGTAMAEMIAMTFRLTNGLLSVIPAGTLVVQRLSDG